MDPEYGQRYRELFEWHWWWRARGRIVLDELQRIRPSGRWPSILDVGCGDGLFFPRLAQMGEVEGVEPDASLIGEGPHRGAIHVASFDERFQPGKRYSLILMLDVLEHLPRPAAALRHGVTLLEPEGTLLATVPAFRLLWTSHDDINHHLTRYTMRSFEKLACEAGLRIHLCRYFFHWLFPAKLTVRLSQAILGRSRGLPSVPTPWINRSLTRLSVLENKLLRPIHLPFGGSLLAAGGVD